MALTPKQKALLDSCPILKEFKDVFEGMSGSTSNDNTQGGDSGNTSNNDTQGGNGGSETPAEP